jgi:hypothetical protein
MSHVTGSANEHSAELRGAIGDTGGMDPPSTNAWEAPVPSSVLSRPRPSRKLWLARVLGTLAVVAFTVAGLFVIDRSMDLPWDGPTGNERYGFHGNRQPKVWICNDGHRHYSLPFWAGAVVCAIPTALWWLVWPRKSQPAGP